MSDLEAPSAAGSLAMSSRVMDTATNFVQRTQSYGDALSKLGQRGQRVMGVFSDSLEPLVDPIERLVTQLDWLIGKENPEKKLTETPDFYVLKIPNDRELTNKSLGKGLEGVNSSTLSTSPLPKDVVIVGHERVSPGKAPTGGANSSDVQSVFVVNMPKSGFESGNQTDNTGWRDVLGLAADVLGVGAVVFSMFKGLSGLKGKGSFVKQWGKGAPLSGNPSTQSYKSSAKASENDVSYSRLSKQGGVHQPVKGGLMDEPPSRSLPNKSAQRLSQFETRFDKAIDVSTLQTTSRENISRQSSLVKQPKRLPQLASQTTSAIDAPKSTAGSHVSPQQLLVTKAQRAPYVLDNLPEKVAADLDKPPVPSKQVTSSKWGKFGKFNGLVNTAVGVADMGRVWSSDASTQDKVQASGGVAGSVAGSALGTWGGAAAGAAIGSVVPVIGTAIGGLVGGVIGSIGGGSLGEMFGSNMADGLFNVFSSDEEAADKKAQQRVLPNDDGVKQALAELKISVEDKRVSVSSVKADNLNLDITGSSMGGLQ